MSEAKRFKTPYTLGVVEDVPGERYYIIGGDAVFFARLPAIDARMEATSEFLVRAANCHDYLLAACKMFDAACFADPIEPVMAEALQMARAAIAKAEAK